MNMTHTVTSKNGYATAIELNPRLGESTEAYIEFCKKVESKICKLKDLKRISATTSFRTNFGDESLISEEKLALLFAQSVLLDLVAQGWGLEVRDSKIFIYSPTVEGKTDEIAKEIIRNTHLLGRDIQLREKSVKSFIKGMERRRLTPKGWHSIFSVMRDGNDLAENLRSIEQLKGKEEKIEALSKTISPYIQFVKSNAVCEHTHLRLGDIWRYFRHTWVNEYKSVPGRSMMILIRDAAAPNHPVIGIAALGSSVVQHKNRDKWIGWHPDIIIDEIVENPTRETVSWLLASVRRLIADIFVKDFLQEGILSRQDLKTPSAAVIQSLMDESFRAIREHRKEPQRIVHNQQKGVKTGSGFWEKEARTFLYRSKRCKQLSKLLSIRQVFQENGISNGRTDKYRQSVIRGGKVRTAVTQLVRMIKAEHVGINMMDITVCGAIAPYNHLLGGKLICMLLCSPEVAQHYAHRYGDHTSIIASAMKGKPVVRKPNLVLLCTTSLYSVGSSQYNRVKIPLDQIGISSTGAVSYKNLGYSKGFGTYHFSKTAIQLGSYLNSRKKEGRRVNSIFGEGVNPLMRKIRESLDFVGLNSEELLLHGNRRVTYGIQLAENFREVLLGKATKVDYLISATNATAKTTKIADYWRRRWLLGRITIPGLIDQVAKHVLSYPVSHGAVVPLEAEDEIVDARLSFDHYN